MKLYLFAFVSAALLGVGEITIAQDTLELTDESSFEESTHAFRYDPRIVLGCVKRQRGCDELAYRYRCSHGIAKFTNRCPNASDNGALTCIGVYCPQ